MELANNKWPKTFPSLTSEQQQISDDFMQYWHEILATRPGYNLLDKFGHTYAIKNAQRAYNNTLEIGAGLGEHIEYEKRHNIQNRNYVALELRNNMANKIKMRFPDVNVQVGDCQKTLPFSDDHFDRILAIHILEHLPNLPAAIKEMYRLCDKKNGIFSVVIPCEGGWLYTLARKLSAQRIFEKKYKQPYKWFIEREHINKPHEIIEELSPYFHISQRSYYPFPLPSINFNLFIGLTLRPKKNIETTQT